MDNIRIQISQTKQNFGIQFECRQEDHLLYVGKDSFLIENSTCSLEDAYGSVLFQYHPSSGDTAKELMSLPRFPLRSGNITDSLGTLTGCFLRDGTGSGKYYRAEFQNHIYDMYLWSTGQAPHLLIYSAETQIAQVEHEAITTNYLDQYTIYLLAEYEYLKDFLCFFVILYDKFECGNHGSAFIGTTTSATAQWSIGGIGKERYHREFMQQNFPDVPIKETNMDFHSVQNTIKEQWDASINSTFTPESFRRGFLNPLALGLCFGIPVMISIIAGTLASVPIAIFIAILCLLFMGNLYFSVWIMCHRSKKQGFIFLVCTYILIFLIAPLVFPLFLLS